jgi:hypothetical protein
MKKLMAAVLVMIVMSWLCSTSFGFLFLYKVSTTVKGADDNTGLKVMIPLKGYLLLNLDDTDGEFVDANLLLYGKDTVGAKKYVQIDYASGSGDLEADVWYIGDFAFIDIWATEGPFSFEMFFSGKEALKDIGLGSDDKKEVASSIKGVTIVWDDFLLGPSGQEVSGSANASATLWTAAVKAINDPLEPWTPDEVVVELIDILDLKGYSAATLP